MFKIVFQNIYRFSNQPRISFPKHLLVLIFSKQFSKKFTGLKNIFQNIYWSDNLKSTSYLSNFINFCIFCMSKWKFIEEIMKKLKKLKELSHDISEKLKNSYQLEREISHNRQKILKNVNLGQISRDKCLKRVVFC